MDPRGSIFFGFSRDIDRGLYIKGPAFGQPLFGLQAAFSWRGTAAATSAQRADVGRADVFFTTQGALLHGPL